MRSALRISVIVRVVSGSPAPAGINVRLEADPGGLIDQQTTDSTGKVTFLPKAFTTYAVTIHERGYRDVSRPVDLSRSPTAGVSITLVPLRDQDEVTAPTSEKGDVVSAADLSIPAPAKKEFDAGQKLLQDKHDVRGSIGHFRKATELYSSFTQAYVLLGLAYLQDQKLKESQAALEQAVRLDPRSGAGYLTLGACLNQQKDYASAEKALNRGLELEPESSEGQYELAKNYWAQRRWQEAEPHALKAETLRPNIAGVHVVMGNILLQKRDNAGALKEFNEYLRLDPKGSMSDAVRTMVSELEKARAATH
jgi:predicted Zn-dependent protease